MWITKGVEMRKRVRRKRKNKVLRKVLILGLCLGISGWLMSCIDKKANVVDDQEVVESDIG